MSHDFTIINNGILRDSRLGSSERGLLVTMLSLPDGWSFSIRGLARILPDSITKISNALNKLEALNYLRRERRYKNGRISNWNYIISDEPMENVDHDPSDDGNSPETPPFFEKQEQYVDELDMENLNQGHKYLEMPHDNKINNNNITVVKNQEVCYNKNGDENGENNTGKYRKRNAGIKKQNAEMLLQQIRVE